MKYLSTILVLLGASATMVASSPAPRPVAVANPAQPSVNVAANNGANVRDTPSQPPSASIC